MQFTYSISDGSFTDTATATISIAPINDAPIAVADTFSGNEADGTVSGNVITQAAAGSLGDRDIEGDAFTAEVVTPPRAGVAYAQIPMAVSSTPFLPFCPLLR